MGRGHSSLRPRPYRIVSILLFPTYGMQRVRRGNGPKIKKERQGMRYVVLCGLCMCLAYRLGDSRGRMDCEHMQSVERNKSERAHRSIQADVSRVVIATPTDDIRRMLRENYTIAE